MWTNAENGCLSSCEQDLSRLGINFVLALFCFAATRSIHSHVLDLLMQISAQTLDTSRSSNGFTALLLLLLRDALGIAEESSAPTTRRRRRCMGRLPSSFSPTQTACVSSGHVLGL